MKLIPKNWAVFQHYKDRCPPWIKLHRELLNDRVFMCLPLASKALAPLLWLLASESKDGSFDAEIDELQFRLRIDHKDLVDGLKPLIDKGFFCDASGALAQRLHVAIPETEGKTETETKPEKKAARKRAAKTTMPENFSVSDRVATWARHNGHHRIDEHLEVFKRKCIAKGYTYASWDDAFMEAIRQDWAGLRGKVSGQTTPLSFAERDEMARRRRWEEMTGRKWPESGEVVTFDLAESETPLLEQRCL